MAVASVPNPARRPTPLKEVSSSRAYPMVQRTPEGWAVASFTVLVDVRPTSLALPEVTQPQREEEPAPPPAGTRATALLSLADVTACRRRSVPSARMVCQAVLAPTVIDTMTSCRAVSYT